MNIMYSVLESKDKARISKDSTMCDFVKAQLNWLNKSIGDLVDLESAYVRSIGRDCLLRECGEIMDHNLEAAGYTGAALEAMKIASFETLAERVYHPYGEDNAKVYMFEYTEIREAALRYLDGEYETLDGVEECDCVVLVTSEKKDQRALLNKYPNINWLVLSTNYEPIMVEGKTYWVYNSMCYTAEEYISHVKNNPRLVWNIPKYQVEFFNEQDLINDLSLDVPYIDNALGLTYEPEEYQKAHTKGSIRKTDSDGVDFMLDIDQWNSTTIVKKLFTNLSVFGSDEEVNLREYYTEMAKFGEEHPEGLVSLLDVDTHRCPICKSLIKWNYFREDTQCGHCGATLKGIGIDFNPEWVEGDREDSYDIEVVEKESEAESEEEESEDIEIDRTYEIVFEDLDIQGSKSYTVYAGVTEPEDIQELTEAEISSIINGFKLLARLPEVVVGTPNPTKQHDVLKDLRAAEAIKLKKKN